MTADETVRLDTIGNGAALELFDMELGRVLDNIADPNTDADKARSITLKISIVPNKLRDGGTVRVECVAKLAPVKPADAILFFGRKSGRRVAVEHDPRQAGLFDEKKPVTALRPVQEEG